MGQNISQGFLDLSIRQIMDGYQCGEITPIDVAKRSIAQTELYENQCHAWVCFDADLLLEQAEHSDTILTDAQKKNQPLRTLEGIPIGVKDIMNTIDFPTQMGSPLWDGFTAGNDARVVFQLKQLGAVVPGKTVTAEFAVHTLGKTLNPHNAIYNPGTSSSGSAAAVALGMVPAALATQTAGSIVRPASFCGVYGYKPSFGLVPRTGMLKTTDSLDTVGFFVTHYEDVKTLFEAVRVHGRNYPISDTALNDSTRQEKPTNRPWRVALAKTHTWEYAPEYAKKALLEWAEKLSTQSDIEVIEPELPEFSKEAHRIHASIYNKTLSYYFQKEFEKAELVSPIMNELIVQGQAVSPAEYQKALKEQEELAREIDTYFVDNDIDVLISLSTAGEAPLREETEKPDPALIWNLCHLPVLATPAFVSPSCMPFGVQILSRRYNDYRLMRFADRLRQDDLIPASVNPLAFILQSGKQPLAV